MSIEDRIAELQASGELSPYQPFRSRNNARRRLYLNDNVLNLKDNPDSAINRLSERGSVEWALSEWASGNRVFDNNRGGAGLLKRLKLPPPEVWEIRITAPVIQVRVFGRFAAQDCFVATDMRTRNSLGRLGSQAWRQAMLDCVADWQRLFPQHGPFAGEHNLLSDYVSENFDEIQLS